MLICGKAGKIRDVCFSQSSQPIAGYLVSSVAPKNSSLDPPPPPPLPDLTEEEGRRGEERKRVTFQSADEEGKDAEDSRSLGFDKQVPT